MHFRRTFSVWYTAIIMAGAVLCSPAIAQNYELPHMGDPSGKILTPTEERELGQRIVNQLRARRLILQDAAITRYVSDLGFKLVSQSDWASENFTFFVVNSQQINAFALPGGFIGINAGLISAAGDESELAGVVAHEIVHVTQRHILRGAEKNSRAGALTTAAMVLGILLSGGDPEAIQAIIGASISLGAQNQLNFTRAHELEADRIGIRLLARAGFDPYGMARFFEKLWKKSRLVDSIIPEILRTHPLSSTRIVEALSRADNIATGQVADSNRFRLIQSRLDVLVNGDRLMQNYAQQASLAKSTVDRHQAEYRLALSLGYANRQPEAARLLEKLVREDEAQISYWVALGEAQLEGKQDTAALQTYARALRLFPQNRELNVSYALALLQLKQPAEAKDVLLRAMGYSREDYSPYYRLIARAFTESNEAASGHYYMGEYLRLQGRDLSAVRQLQLALRSSDLPPGQKLQAKARLTELTNRMPKQLQREASRPLPNP